MEIYNKVAVILADLLGQEEKEQAVYLSRDLFSLSSSPLCPIRFSDIG